MTSKDLYSILHVRTKIYGAAALIVLNCVDSESQSGAGGNRFDAWLERVKKYDYQSNEIIRTLKASWGNSG